MATNFLPFALLLIISLAPILSSATSKCPGYHSVPDLLEKHRLPPGLFPDVTKFECNHIGDKSDNKLKLIIHIPCTTHPLADLEQFCCRVTTTNFTAEYSKTITSIVSENLLSNLTGVEVTFEDLNEFVRVNEVQGFFDLAFQLETPKKFSDPVYFTKDYMIPPKCPHTYLFYGRPLLVAA